MNDMNLQTLNLFVSLAATIGTVIAGYMAYLAANRAAQATEILTSIELARYNDAKRKYWIMVIVRNTDGIIEVSCTVNNYSTSPLSIGLAMITPSDDPQGFVIQKANKHLVLNPCASETITMLKELNKNLFKQYPQIEVITLHPSGKKELGLSRTTDFIIALEPNHYQILGNEKFEE